MSLLRPPFPDSPSLALDMSPKAPPVFETLPVEVLGNILRQMASPEDLYSTIRASPRALDSFLEYREQVLIEVLQTHLPAEILAEFLGLLHIPMYEDFNHVPNRSDLLREARWGPEDASAAWERCRYEAWPIIVTAFFETHFEKVRTAKSSEVQRYSLPPLSHKHQINYIISMYGALKRFIRDYQYFVRTNLAGIAPPIYSNSAFRCRDALPPQLWPDLSENETVRLQRGFLRYELCSRLNAIPNWETYIIRSHEVNSRTPFEFLSSYLQRWEEEEIRCVWTYVLRQYQVVIRNIVADFHCDVRRLSRQAGDAPGKEVSLVSFMTFEFQRAFFSGWSASMSCLGLPLLQQLLRSEIGDQRRFVKNTAFETYPSEPGTLFLANINPLRREWHAPENFINLPTTNGQSPIYTSVTIALAGWPLHMYDKWRKMDRAEKGLKEIGWVFWEDRGRLEYFGLPGYDSGASNAVENCLNRLCHQTDRWLGRFEVETAYPEQEMYVTTEDYQEELSAKYAMIPTPPSGELFFLNRLRSISDWSSKECSPAFQEICSGMS